MRVLIAMMIVVPFCVLINDFIAMWVGAEYILPASVVVLLVMDLYIHFVHSVNVDFINAAGLFREDRDNEIIAAVLNITLSILGAKTIGLAGVLLGTVVSQMWFLVREKLRRVQIVLAGGQRGLSEVLAQKYR